MIKHLMTTKDRESESKNVSTFDFRLSTFVLIAAVSAGCSRSLTIEQDEYVNTAMHQARDPQNQTGEPLEVVIVCVAPRDLKKQGNERLKPGAGITSREWYQKGPKPGDTVEMENNEGRFRLPGNQIYLLTNDTESAYGKQIGAALRGGKLDGKIVKKQNIDFKFWSLHDSDAVIYVFGKFTDKDGNVLPVPPAKFHPPGAYESNVSIKIGVDKGRDNYGQYIANTTPRKMHGND